MRACEEAEESLAPQRQRRRAGGGGAGSAASEASLFRGLIIAEFQEIISSWWVVYHLIRW